MGKEVEKYDRDLVARQIWHSRKIGHSWDDIVEEIEMNHGVRLTHAHLANLYNTHHAALSSMVSAEERQQRLMIALAQLDELQSAHWNQAVLGDPVSSKFVLDVLKERHRILGLDRADGTDTAIQQTVLVIGQNKDEWVEALTHGKNNRVIMPGVARDDGSDAEETS